jgi:hypothetical protein
VGENRLTENGTVQDDLSVGIWVPKPPGLVVSGVPNENALDSMGCQQQVLVLLEMNVGEAAEWACERQQGLTAIEQLEGGEGHCG